MNLEVYHVKGIEENIKNDEFFPQDIYTRFSSHRSMEEMQLYQWQQQYPSPIETLEYDQQLCQQIADVAEQVKSLNEKFDKFLEKYDSRRYEVTFKNLETQIDEVVDEEKVEREVKKTEEIEIEKVVAEEKIEEKIEEEVVKLKEREYEKPLPYPKIYSRKEREKQLERFMEIHKKLEITIPFSEALQQIPSDAKFLKELLMKERKYIKKETIEVQGNCSAVIQRTLPPKLQDPRSFIIQVVERKKKNRKCAKIKKKLKRKKNRKRGRKKRSYAKPFPHQEKNHRKENRFKYFMEIFKKLEIKVPMIDAWKHVLGSINFFKRFSRKKKKRIPGKKKSNTY